MSILYKVVQRANPQNRGAAPKYYLDVKARGSIDFEQFLDAVCKDTTLNRDEVRMVFNKGFKELEAFSKLGFNVHLGALGHTKVTLRSQGVDSEAEATANLVSDIVPHFVFSESFRTALKKEKLERAK